ncbi:biotin transporter BioY [Alphaproteobacteria bacterium]|jgi:biotin transport system substrate-specific component|nr:biotin transporter BioY [Alphaproteobacteria bacterium]
MNTAASPTNTLAKTLLPIDNAVVRNLILAIVGSLALWVSAKLSIPFWPVPLTMQTLVVLVIGMAFGARLGAATVLLYLAEGAVGLPVFSGTPEKGIGLAYMMSTTGGYLVGFVLAAGAVGFLAERGWDRSPVKTALAMVLGNILIYMTGLLWLGTIVGWDKPVLAWGLTPFLAGDAVKIAAAAVLMPLVWRLVSAFKR